jgi:hypothetical protein
MQHHRDHWLCCSACSQWHLVTFAAKTTALQSGQPWTCADLGGGSHCKPGSSAAAAAGHPKALTSAPATASAGKQEIEVPCAVVMAGSAALAPAQSVPCMQTPAMATALQTRGLRDEQDQGGAATAAALTSVAEAAEAVARMPEACRRPEVSRLLAALHRALPSLCNGSDAAAPASRPADRCATGDTAECNDSEVIAATEWPQQSAAVEPIVRQAFKDRAGGMSGGVDALLAALEIGRACRARH